MAKGPTRFGEKFNNLIIAWSKFAPESKFAGMSLAEFKTAIATSIDSRSQIADMRMEIKALIGTRAAGDVANEAIVARVIAGILADAQFGPDSGLYRALNYVPKSERASGLVRKTSTTNAATSSATVTSTPSVTPTVANATSTTTATSATTNASLAPSTKE